MKKITLNNEKYYLEVNSESQEELTLKELIELINTKPKFFGEYEVSEEILISIIEDPLFNQKAYLLTEYVFNEELIYTLLEKKYLKLSDLEFLNLKTYLNFNKDFIKEFQDHLNWTKIILRKANVTGLVSFNVLEKNKINEFNLWDLVSSFQLEKKFIKKNREKLNWNIISITNDFSYDELPDYPELVNYKVDDVRSKIKPFIKETLLNEDGFLAFDNVSSNENEYFNKLRKSFLENKLSISDIVEKMNNIRKNTYSKSTPNIVDLESKPKVDVEITDENNEDVIDVINKETTITNYNILGATFSKKFTIPVGNVDTETSKKSLEELINNYKEPIEFDNNSDELILDGKTQINYTKDILLPQDSVECPEIELITDTPSNPLTDLYKPVKEEPSIITKLFNKIKSFFNGK